MTLGKVKVLEGREEAYTLMRAAADRLGYDRGDRADFRRLARDAERADVTFLNVLEKPGIPRTDTLQDLARVTGVPMETWLSALDLLPRRHAKQGLTPARRRLLQLAEGRDEVFINRLVDWLMGNPFLLDEADDTPRGSGPTPANRTSRGYRVASPQVVGTRWA